MTIIYLPTGHKDLESFLSSLEQEGDYLEHNSLDGDILDMSNLTPTARKSYKQELEMDGLMTPPSLETSKILSKEVMRKPMLDTLMLSAPASLDPVSPSQPPVDEKVQMTVATCGPQQLNASAWYDHDTASWKTYQACFLVDTLELYSLTWPKAGMMQDGVFYPQRKWEHRIVAIDSGLWPTPKASIDGTSQKTLEMVRNGTAEARLCRVVLMPDKHPKPQRWEYPSVADAHPRALNRKGPYWGKGQKHLQAQVYNRMWPTPTKTNAGIGGHWSKDDTVRWTKNNTPRRVNRQGTDGSVNLARLVKMLPTPQKMDAKLGSNFAMGKRYNSLSEYARKTDRIGGKLNPTWVEWLMGWPLGWTDLKPLEMGKYRNA